MQPDPARTMARQEQWKDVLYATSVEGDVEHLIAALQEKHGYTRDGARAELWRRLSRAVS
jgi:hypothetical protein